MVHLRQLRLAVSKIIISKVNQRTAYQWRVIHRAGLTTVPVVLWEGTARRQGAPNQLPNFYHAVLTFEWLKGSDD